jgi:hypothetical protein
MRDGLYRVVTDRFVAGFVIEAGQVTECAPILRRNLARWLPVAERISMSTEAPFSVTGKAGGRDGVLATLRGDSYEEFVANLKAALGDVEGETFAAEVYPAALTSLLPFSNATANVNASVGASTVGQPLNQPGREDRGQSTPQAPPGVTYPGDCPHGTRSYKDSMVRGKSWRRWECATPWSAGSDNSGRCKALNV